jgi:adenylate cyclase
MHVLSRGDVAQRIRLISGLVLMAFATTHFLNHAVGLISLEAMLQVQAWRTAVTRSWPVSLILLTAIAAHVGLALWKLARRATLSLPGWELVQIATGLLVPVLLLQHVLHNRGVNLLAGTRDSYRYELVNLWPGYAWDQTALLLLVWVHGCIGMHFWLRLAPWWRRLQGGALAIAVAIPLLALTGFSVAGREMAAAMAVPGAWERLMSEAAAPTAEVAARLDAIKTWLQGAFAILAAMAILAPLVRQALPRLKSQLSISYLAGPEVRSQIGPTLLEISRGHGIPHASACGGRGRCSTCRVRIVGGAGQLGSPSTVEVTALRGLATGPDVRLACQLRPGADIAVERLVSAQRSMLSLGSLSGEGEGIERTLAVLFFDLRGFTQLSDDKLPYDVVFLLNRLFTVASEAIRAEGGRIDKYLGDGLMAVFGEDVDADEACRRAVRAARALDLALERISAELQSEIGAPLRCAMGLHVGPLVIGRIGCPVTAEHTVIGRTVNAASRLESLAKEANCQLVVSRQVLKRARVSLNGLTARRVDIRGLSGPVNVVTVARARDLKL